MRRVGNFLGWKAVMDEIRKKRGPLFGTIKTIGGRVAIGSKDFAFCCNHMTAVADRSYGPRKVYAHLRTVVHFQNWCTWKPIEEVLDRFPEVKVLLAERALTESPRTKKNL